MIDKKYSRALLDMIRHLQKMLQIYRPATGFNKKMPFHQSMNSDCGYYLNDDISYWVVCLDHRLITDAAYRDHTGEPHCICFGYLQNFNVS